MTDRKAPELDLQTSDERFRGFMKNSMDEKVSIITQERAYMSPIWYTPH